MGAGQKPISVVVMETAVAVTVGISGTVALLLDRISSDAAMGLWAALLAYAFKNGYQYLTSRGEVIGRGSSPRAPPRRRSR